jgi:hypothetical protein
MEEIKLGKITSAELGFGGYQDVQFGLSVVMEGDGWGVNTFINAGWNDDLSPDKEYCHWTEDERTELRALLCKKIDVILRSAKVNYISQLKDIPVEAILEKNMLKDWRVLEEVL